MTEVAAKFSEYFITAFCVLLLGGDGKEMQLTSAGDEGPGETIKIVRTKEGYEVFSYHDYSRRLGTIVPVKDRPNVYRMTVMGRSQEVDLTEAAGLLKPLTPAPQELKLRQGKVRINARGDVIFLNFEGQPKTYVVHGLGRKLAPTTMPAEALKRQARFMARKFWGAFARGDLEAAGRFYADKVTVKYYSHMLKRKYGVVTEDNVATDVTVDRKRLIAGYAKMLKEVGKEKWVKAYAAIDPKKISITTAGKGDKPFRGVEPGDMILKVAPVEDEGLTFVFRPDEHGAYWIVMEKNDY